jgi:hypothetical protein
MEMFDTCREYCLKLVRAEAKGVRGKRSRNCLLNNKGVLVNHSKRAGMKNLD